MGERKARLAFPPGFMIIFGVRNKREAPWDYGMTR